MRKNAYYIILETHNEKISNIIETYNDLDTVVGLTGEIMRLDKLYSSGVVILDWKRLNKHWWN